MKGDPVLWGQSFCEFVKSKVFVIVDRNSIFFKKVCKFTLINFIRPT